MNNKTEQSTLWAELERAGDVPAPAEEILLTTRATLRRAAGTETLRADVLQLRRGRRYAVRALVGVSAAAAVLGIVGLVNIGGGQPADAAAAAVLTRAATTLEAEPTPGPGQFLHVKTVDTQWNYDSASGDPITSELETWLPADKDAAGMSRTTVDPLPDGTAQTVDELGLPSDFHKGLEEWSDRLIRDHPEEPAALLEALRTVETDDGVQHIDDNEQMFSDATSLLTNNRASLDLKADVLRALATMDGVKVVDKDAQIGDRTGVALGYGKFPVYILLNPTSGDYLGMWGMTERVSNGVGPKEPLWTSVTEYEVTDTAPWTDKLARLAKLYNLDLPGR